jgi:hypothetical protein
MDTPGDVRHLPFEWTESAKKAQAHPPQPPPIVSLLKRRPWLVPGLIARDVPR